jgi:general secretion pathway protein E
MSLLPIDALRATLPAAERICQWLLVHRGLKPVDLERARRLAQESAGDNLLDLLSRLGLVSELALAEAWAACLPAPLLRADEAALQVEALPALSERFLRHHRIVPLGTERDGLHVLAANPGDRYVLQALAYAAQTPVYLSVGAGNDIEALIERYFGQGRSAMGSLIETLDEEGGAQEDIEHLKDLASEAPVIRLVNLILQRAVEQRASDIHIEPFETQLKVRYRIDGVLHDAEAPPTSSSAAVISRLKIMARLDIAERRLPQDGRIMLRIQGKALDLRVSTVPT